MTKFSCRSRRHYRRSFHQLNVLFSVWNSFFSVLLHPYGDKQLCKGEKKKKKQIDSNGVFCLSLSLCLCLCKCTEMSVNMIYADIHRTHDCFRLISISEYNLFSFHTHSNERYSINWHEQKHSLTHALDNFFSLDLHVGFILTKRTKCVRQQHIKHINKWSRRRRRKAINSSSRHIDRPNRRNWLLTCLHWNSHTHCHSLVLCSASVNALYSTYFRYFFAAAAAPFKIRSSFWREIKKSLRKKLCIHSVGFLPRLFVREMVFCIWKSTACFSCKRVYFN